MQRLRKKKKKIIFISVVRLRATRSITRFSIDDSHELHAVVVLGDDRGGRGKTSHVSRTRKKGAVELTNVRRLIKFGSSSRSDRNRSSSTCASLLQKSARRTSSPSQHPPRKKPFSMKLAGCRPQTMPHLRVTRRKQPTSQLRSRRRQ